MRVERVEPAGPSRDTGSGGWLLTERTVPRSTAPGRALRMAPGSCHHPLMGSGGRARVESASAASSAMHLESLSSIFVTVND
jgi:hypothetical protein